MASPTVFTITDEPFLPGVCGLINALRSGGFRGRIIVGMPTALRALDGVEGVESVVLDVSGLWVGFHKPALLLRHATDSFLFLDADIIVAQPGFLEQVEAFSTIGPLLALEGLVGPRDGRRLRWAERLGTSEPRRDAWAYYNGGFLAGRVARDRNLLEEWERSIRAVLSRVAGYQQDAEFPFGDQDVLNAVMQTWTGPVVSIQFPDWWSAASSLNPFLHVGAFARTAFYHSTGPKPWQLTAVPARNPTPYESLWFHHAVLEPSAVRLPCDLPISVRKWLEGAWSGRLASRAKRLTKRLAGW